MHVVDEGEAPVLSGLLVHSKENAGHVAERPEQLLRGQADTREQEV